MAKPKLCLIPTTIGDKVYSILPSDGVGDFDFTRASTATRINAQGLIETVASGENRLNYSLLDGEVVGCPHLLLEPQATNVIINSNIFNPNTSVVVDTNNTISPNGTLNAVKVTANSGTSLKLVDTNGASSGTYRFSVFAKKNTHNIIQLGGGGIIGHANFNLETGEYSSDGLMDYYGNGWYRCTVQFSAGTPSSHYISFSDSLSAARLSTSVSDGSFYLYGMQSETTSYTTSYIPTSGSIVTRVAETCTGSGDAATFNDSEGVLMAEISALANDGTERRLSLQDNATYDAVRITYTPAANSLTAVVYNNSANQFNAVHILNDATTFNKIAIKYKQNDFALWVNGIEVATDTLGSVFSQGSLDTLSYELYGIAKVYAKTKQIQYFDTALSDTELEQLTSWDSFRDMAQAQLYSIQ